MSEVLFNILQHRSFTNPKPMMRDILNDTSTFMDAINRSLKMGMNRGCRLTVKFRTDVFKFLFEGKGREYSYGTGRLYKQEDFDEQ